MYGKMSFPLTLAGSFDEGITTAYEYFSEHIYNKEKRPSLFGKDIFVEAHEKIDDRPQGFWHIVSLEEKHHFTKVLPCTNDATIDNCEQNCNAKTRMVSIKYNTEDRSLCLYRASRIPWIVDIINLANNKDPDIAVWLKPGGSSSSDKLYLRYNHDGADYVVIFSSEKRFYRIISAFPVFYVSEKADFDKDYSNYKWEYNPQSK